MKQISLYQYLPPPNPKNEWEDWNPHLLASFRLGKLSEDEAEAFLGEVHRLTLHRFDEGGEDGWKEIALEDVRPYLNGWEPASSDQVEVAHVASFINQVWPPPDPLAS